MFGATPRHALRPFGRDQPVGVRLERAMRVPGEEAPAPARRAAAVAVEPHEMVLAGCGLRPGREIERTGNGAQEDRNLHGAGS